MALFCEEKKALTSAPARGLPCSSLTLPTTRNSGRMTISISRNSPLRRGVTTARLAQRPGALALV